ncbi:Asp-tRNA(Asn)/Glu-tRNA(Gln) amidotransferase GatCAB subunit A [Desertihabitans brevis]|uniref:Asp-tRNA(Asn)/Glu-tRNA(Gln) amidotransferase GatCAB subunit A n=1 Tax=Desertihabitans brevis TaxID=2268447 RepID=A0A367YQ41_9ACTN|nr:amidase family protein [Desertihabitans brevis]RCK68003.1 Asp-tRNA(Asn)/Glu-tRNA(Gln) amidotransferase GatCAB subunit A [Desertihabitans brevis]
MYRTPDHEEVQQVAEQFGMRLTAAEAEVFARHIGETLTEMDDFVQSRIEEPAPPRFPGPRSPGHRPGPEDDPYNAWTWKCEIPGAESGLLAGKTVSFKDHTAVAGMPLTFGSFALEGLVPDYDATVVQRSLEAGATVVGKNVMNGLSGGFGFGGGIGDYGRPTNPHSPDHLTGGSSSGSAAALASGQVDISFGGDQGGSIRIPASWTGTVGHKPTFGLVSHFGIGFGSDQSIDYTGPMTMTVADAAAALEATAGYDGFDPRQGRQVPDRYDATSRLTDGIDGLRIGILTEGFAGATVEVDSSVREAVEIFAKLGATISEVSVPEHATIGRAQTALMAEGGLAVRNAGFFGAWSRTWYPSDTIAAVNRVWASHQELLDPRALANQMAGVFSKRFWSGRVYAKAQNVRSSFIAAYDRALSEVDVLVMPTTITQAPRYEQPADRTAAVELAMKGSITYSAVANTRPFNYTGHPALALPCEKRNGLPVSIQLVGRMFEDDLLLRAAWNFAETAPFAAYTAIDA